MQLSCKTQNACLAVLELARRQGDTQPVALRTIAETHGVSAQFLVQILLQLKRAGIVQSTRGSGGGYRLAIPPADISLLDIITAMEGPQDCEVTFQRDNAVSRVLRDIWCELAAAEQERLAEVTIDQLMVATEADSAGMYYI